MPESVLCRLEGEDECGGAVGLDDRELADLEELERQVFKKYWGQMLTLAVKRRRPSIRPTIDEDGKRDWGAFGTVDFERWGGGFRRAHQKVERLRERLRDRLILVDIVKERLSGKAKYLVLKYLRMGIAGLEHVVNEDMRGLAELELEVCRLRKRIGDVQESNRQKRQVQQTWSCTKIPLGRSVTRADRSASR